MLKENTSDSVLTNRDIWGVVWSNAILLLQRETDVKHSIHNLNIFKTIEIKMIEVSTTDGTSFNLPLDCTMYRSAEKLPEIVESRMGYIIRYITTLDRSSRFDLVTPQSFRDKQKITKGRGKLVFIDNGYLYSSFKYALIISALFSNIKIILEKEIKSGKVCSILDIEAPIPEYMIAPVYQMSLQSFGIFKQVPQDTTTNINPNN